MGTGFDDLLEGRRSVRAYTDEPVSRSAIEKICRQARLAPSGANLQPGRYHVLTGAPLDALVALLLEAARGDAAPAEEYSYFPKPMPAHLKARQREAGHALYAALEIGRRDVEGRRRQFQRNYAFFGAPVGVIVSIERGMGAGCFMDLGMSLMSFFLAAESQGLGTTGIGAMANHGPLIHRALGLGEEEMVVCGVALGHADPAAPENRVRTAREDLPAFTSFRGF
ncbi:MAG: oxidoreductase [Rhodovulum sulfidophilum]|uniref:Oxidoreductase n=1 Tax=Rhodovulum sulfidophilum TaxID=35806 RepID=A0A2W5QF97_RHOSU|nr:MAG: oxidoreductase [Rhodovulum sulfidophilum]